MPAARAHVSRDVVSRSRSCAASYARRSDSDREVGGEEAEADSAATSSSPVAAMADLMTSQEDASAALAEGFREFEEIEKEIASELGVTVEELEEAEDYDLEAPPPEGFEWGVTY